MSLGDEERVDRHGWMDGWMMEGWTEEWIDDK